MGRDRVILHFDLRAPCIISEVHGHPLYGVGAKRLTKLPRLKAEAAAGRSAELFQGTIVLDSAMRQKLVNDALTLLAGWLLAKKQDDEGTRYLDAPSILS